MVEQNALKTQQSADASYRDSEMDRLDYINSQDAVVAQVQSAFAAYNQVKKTIPLMEKSVELQELSMQLTQKRQQLGQALPLGHGAAVGQVDARAQLAQLAGQALRLGQQRGRILGGAFALLGQRAGAQAVFHFIQPGLYVLSQDQRFRKFHFGYPPVYF